VLGTASSPAGKSNPEIAETLFLSRKTERAVSSSLTLTAGRTLLWRARGAVSPSIAFLKRLRGG
jgi:hypothetical protein